MTNLETEVERLRHLCQKHGVDPEGCLVCWEADVEGRVMYHTVTTVDIDPARIAALESLARTVQAMIFDGHPCSNATGLSGKAADEWFAIVGTHLAALELN